MNINFKFKFEIYLKLNLNLNLFWTLFSFNSKSKLDCFENIVFLRIMLIIKIIIRIKLLQKANIKH